MRNILTQVPKLAKVTLFFGLILGLFACGPGGGNSPGNTIECAKGRCLCEGDKSCTHACPEGGCKYYCSTTGLCDLSCDGGNCEFTLTGKGEARLSCKGGGCQSRNTTTGDVTYDCAGNGCQMLCIGKTQTCTLTGCTKDCKLTCMPGNPNCKNECTDPSCQ